LVRGGASGTLMHDNCPICGAGEPALIDDRPCTPVLMNRLYRLVEEARAAVWGVLEVVACRRCGFAWNRAFDPALIVYDEDYENDQTGSAAFLAHVRGRAADIVSIVPVGEPIDYLEIGCGQGAFIAEVGRVAAAGLRSAEGFDPAWRGRDGEGPVGSRIHKSYFTAETARLLEHAPNVVTSRHTIEHVPDPLRFLRTVRRALGPQSRARIFIETPCIAWIIAHDAMQDLFYEHCSIFTAEALRLALEKADFADVTVRHVFGGQYLWASAVAANDVVPEPLPQPGVVFRGEFGQDFTARWTAAVHSARRAGTVALWGAGAKGVTFALLTDPDGSRLDCAIDINPAKQGLRLAGSGLAVVSPGEAARRAPTSIFVMNPNYLSEIDGLAASLGMKAALIPID
jgi:SAM-dependent methyltransferase